MSVIRVVKNQNYTVMSNTHLKEKRMSLKAKGLLSMVLSLPDTWNYSISGLVSICKENVTAIRSTLKELKDFGYLEVIKKTSDKTKSGRFEYEYIFYENPQNPILENLYMETQYIENPPQLSTKLLNTKKENTNNKILGVTEVPPSLPVNTYHNVNEGIAACLDYPPLSPQTPLSPNLLDRVEKKKPKVKKTKEQRRDDWVAQCITICDKFDFSESVLESLEIYFNYLADFGTQFPLIAIDIQLQKLSEVQPDLQTSVIKTTMGRGWKSLVYVIEQDNKKATENLPSYRIQGGENGRTKEERQAWYDKYKDVELDL